MATNNPPAKAGERESFESLYRRAAEGLTKLFGSEKEKGIFQQEPLPAGFASRTEFVRSIMDAPGNKAFFDALPQPFTNVLATVMAARGNPNFPPDLVVEFTFRPSDEEEDEEATKENRVENLRALAEIHLATNGRVSLRLPFNGKMDFQGAVIGMFLALTEDEKSALQLLKVEQKHSSDLQEALGEIQPRTPVQRLSARAMRWAERREAAHAAHAEQRDREDAAAALPRVAQVTKPAPAPAKPVIPDLSVLTGGAAQPPAVLLRALPRGKKAISPAVVPPAAPPPVEEPKSPAPTVDEVELAASFLGDQADLVAKALAAQLRKGVITLAQANAIAKAKGLL